MQFISFKFLNPPVVTPIEYSYQAEGENCIGDVVRARCGEPPVPELTGLVKQLSMPLMQKMFGVDVAMAHPPFHFAMYGIELRQASDKKSWTEEVAFHLMYGLPGHEVKSKTPFFGLFDTYQGSYPGTRENENQDVLGQDLTYTVRQFIDRAMAYINGERAQTVLEFAEDAEPEDAKYQALPGFGSGDEAAEA